MFQSEHMAGRENHTSQAYSGKGPYSMLNSHWVKCRNAFCHPKKAQLTSARGQRQCLPIQESWFIFLPNEFSISVQ